MKMEKTSFTVAATGESDWLNFEDETLTPDMFEFFIGPRSATNETHSIYSNGRQDIANDRKFCISTYYDGSVNGTRRSTSEAFTHYKNVSSTLTKVIGGYVSQVDEGRFKFTASVADSAYVVDCVAIQF